MAGHGFRAGFVSLIGRPNAGKSTLLNRLVGSKLAIISDKPQTTRTRIVGVRNLACGQIIYVDTPGIHRPLHRMNVRMVDVALESMRQADVVGLVVDVTAPPGHGDQFVLERVKQVHHPVFLILNKIDLVSRPSLLPAIDRWRALAQFAEIVPVSASNGENVDRLEDVLLTYLPESDAPLYPDEHAADPPERFFVSETVRERVLQHTRAEIPFSSAVVVDRLEEPDRRGLMRIYCSILVDRESQKAIVIGRGGQLIKLIGSEARQELERFFQTRIFLDLTVKVRERWREDEGLLDDLGVWGPES